MGWVTLTLRKTELKRTHADYQKQLLDISREKRQFARSHHYEQLCVRNDMNAELRAIDSMYDAQKETQQGLMDAAVQETRNSSGEITTTTDQAAYESAKRAYDQAVEDAQRDKNEAKARWEEELAQLEEEANDFETMLDQEQVEVEAQLEAISAEIESVGSAISSQVQASTIKLG